MIALSLNVCSADEFNCDDGGCVNMTSRCNGKLDCEDRSDEIECDQVVTDVGYMKVKILKLRKPTKNVIVCFL